MKVMIYTNPLLHLSTEFNNEPTMLNHQNRNYCAGPRVRVSYKDILEGTNVRNFPAIALLDNRERAA